MKTLLVLKIKQPSYRMTNDSRKVTDSNIKLYQIKAVFLAEK